jgi:hypothetical protein
MSLFANVQTVAETKASSVANLKAKHPTAAEDGENLFPYDHLTNTMKKSLTC